MQPHLRSREIVVVGERLRNLQTECGEKEGLPHRGVPGGVCRFASAPEGTEPRRSRGMVHRVFFSGTVKAKRQNHFS